ncbi:MAG: FtsX-like permease family protein [Alphaproteobacteria bacterium]|nr:FtsX-like permease family protein [Alphaproteobacteria bacterium]
MINPLPVVTADLRRSRAGSARAADPFDLLIGAPGSETQLVMSAVYLQAAALPLIDGKLLGQIMETKRARFAAPIGFGDNWQGYPIVGTAAEFLAQPGFAPAEGRVFTHMLEAVVGAQVKIALGAHVKPSHGMRAAADDDHEAEHHGVEYAVVGRMAPTGSPWDRAVIVPIEAVWWTHALSTGHAENDALVATAIAAGKDDHDVLGDFKIGGPWDDKLVPGVPAIAVKPLSVSDAYVLRQRYRRDGTMALFPAEVLIQLYSLLGDARTVLATVAVATQALVIGAVLLAVFASLAQRRKPIAILRALGASRGYVFTAVWAHVALLIVLGSVLGLGLGWLGALAMAEIVAGRTGLSLPVSIGQSEILMVLALIAVGCVLAVIPAWASYRLPPSAGLRS